MSIAISLILIGAPVLIIYCAVKAIQHTIIIRTAKRKNEMPTALIASLWEINGPDRRFNVR